MLTLTIPTIQKPGSFWTSCAARAFRECPSRFRCRWLAPEPGGITELTHRSARPDSRTRRTKHLVSQEALSRNRVPELVSAFAERDRSSSSRATRLRVEVRLAREATVIGSGELDRRRMER